MTATTTPAVYRAMAAVAAALCKQGIGKDRKNAQQGFNFRGVDDVYAALAPLLAEHKLLVLPNVTGREASERTTKSGGTLFCVTLTVRYDFVSAEDGSIASATVCGEGMDSGDKATSKALSIAFKYAAFQVFCIPVEGMPDPDEESHQVAPKAAPARPAAKVAQFGNKDDALKVLQETADQKALAAWGDRVAASKEWLSEDDLALLRRAAAEKSKALKAGAA